MDLFIIELQRGNGYAIQLVDEIINHPELKNINSWKLVSVDAQGLYQKYGFKALENLEKMMELKK
jgi:ribosomal protein S18 acetylase RimI-like enzyme